MQHTSSCLQPNLIMKLMLFSHSLSLNMAFPSCPCEKVRYFVVNVTDGRILLRAEPRHSERPSSANAGLLALPDVSHSACTWGQLVKRSQQPCLGWSTTEMKQRQRGAEETRHWEATSEFNFLTKQCLKTQTYSSVRQRAYSQNSNYSYAQGNNGLSDPRPQEAFKY